MVFFLKQDRLSASVIAWGVESEDIRVCYRRRDKREGVVLGLPDR
jgi:hypothetical protein